MATGFTVAIVIIQHSLRKKKIKKLIKNNKNIIKIKIGEFKRLKTLGEANHTIRNRGNFPWVKRGDTII